MIRSYVLPNVGLARAARERAEQLALLPGHMLNREAKRSGGLIIQCPKRHVICRVYRTPAGTLFVPTRRRVRASVPSRNGPSTPAWLDAEPYWIEHSNTTDVVRARCGRCAEIQRFTVGYMLDGLRAGKKALTLPPPDAIT